MTGKLLPRDENEIVEIISSAAFREQTIEIMGHGTKAGIGRAAQTEFTLDLSAIKGIELYEPNELILSAKAGTPVAEIEKLLVDNNQELAFEPMDFDALLNKTAGRGTLGGMIAANLSGPRRIKAGAVRDYALGVTAVSGRAEIFKSGGRVVKNVTGYDLSKFVTGSWGTLCAMTSLTIKVLPAAEDAATVLVLGLDAAKASEAMSLAMGSSCEVSAAAHLPERVAAKITGQAGKAGRAVTALRLEGIPASVAYRKAKLEELLKSFGRLGALGRDQTLAFWRSVRDAVPFADKTNRAVWRISTVPTEGPRVGAAISAATGAEIFYDWAGGLIWAEMPGLLPEEKAVRAALGGNGHATLLRADPTVRPSSAAFEPLDPGLAALIQRVKASFDPKGILNPGRMYAGV
jgi:glycolate oxidase FAD binding subunit